MRSILPALLTDIVEVLRATTTKIPRSKIGTSVVAERLFSSHLHSLSRSFHATVQRRPIGLALARSIRHWSRTER